ncbi:MAG: glycosyltransferase family 2 protein [Chloroflexi bacterium]|nr:MAG: glycosyltransferase family 2 protein [Chloroflexota bacterium]
MNDPIELSIVMPCLNEARTVQICIEKALRGIRALGISGEVIVADNGSTDDSCAIASAAGARVVSVQTKGYGAALMGGIAAANGRYVLMADADASYDLEAIGPFVERLRTGDDLVMGNRFKGGIEPGAMPSLHRYVGNPVLSFVARLFFGGGVGDFHSGMRAFRTDAIRKLDLRTTGMEFASEMAVKAHLHQLKVSEVPIHLYPDKRGRPPHLRTWRDGWRHLRFLLLYSPRWLFLYPGAALMLVGALVGLWLLPGTQVAGGVGFDVHTLIYAAGAVILGFQAVAFALFTKIFAISEGLLPEDPRLNRLFRYITLEWGLVSGAVLLIVGVGAGIAAVRLWQEASFGALDQTGRTLRIVIVSVTALALGLEMILASFFFSVLGLRRR